MRVSGLIILVGILLYQIVLTVDNRDKMVQKVQYSLDSTQHVLDSVQLELKQCRSSFRSHLKDCSWISKAQIKQRNGIYITLYREWDNYLINTPKSDGERSN